jgi:hypothetical protein
MRKIDLQSPTSDEWKDWYAKCQKETQALIQSKQQSKPSQISDLYKQRSIKQSYFAAKGPPFHDKCAYCEAPLSDFQYGDVEHFRPKAGVSDENNKVIYLNDSAGRTTSTPHPGYYWLAYDWHNLLPTCTTCNRGKGGDSSIGKRTRFPVQGFRAQVPGEESKEQSLLINPTSSDPDDDPQKHLKVDPKDGLMLSLSVRGQMCINIFGLNKRDDLVRFRKQTCRNARAEYLIVTDPERDLSEREKAIARLQIILTNQEPFSSAAHAALEPVRLSHSRIFP